MNEETILSQRGIDLLQASSQLVTDGEPDGHGYNHDGGQSETPFHHVRVFFNQKIVECHKNTPEIYPYTTAH